MSSQVTILMMRYLARPRAAEDGRGKSYRTPLGSYPLDFLGAGFQYFGSSIGGGDRMKPYPQVEELLAPVH